MGGSLRGVYINFVVLEFIYFFKMNLVSIRKKDFFFIFFFKKRLKERGNKKKGKMPRERSDFDILIASLVGTH